jgi:hypothetical protein
MSLLEHLELSQVNCLNEAEGHGFKAIVAQKSRNSSERHLLSDADEQLLLNIPVGILAVWFNSSSSCFCNSSSIRRFEFVPSCCRRST